MNDSECVVNQNHHSAPSVTVRRRYDCIGNAQLDCADCRQVRFDDRQRAFTLPRHEWTELDATQSLSVARPAIPLAAC